MAWVPPTHGQVKCERCPRTAITVADGWMRVEVFVEGEPNAKTLDFCALCKLHVVRALRALAPKALWE